MGFDPRDHNDARDGEVPEGVWLPDQGVAPYRGRG